MAAQLLATKLFIPTPRAELVSRARLITHLNTCFSHQLTLVSAPAGYGKTTLISEWAKSCACPVAWLTVDEGDNDPTRLLEYLHAAFQNAGIPAAGPEPSPPGLPDCLSPLINALSAQSEPVVLILDDYHLLASQAAHHCLTFLLEHQPDHLHIILATRADPPLPLASLRGRGQLAEIRMADLRFTEDEAVRLVRQVEGCKLSAQDVKTLTARTEGWAAGLQMAAAALQAQLQTGDPEQAIRFIQAFSGSNRYILDYMVEEVLANISEPVRSFLYQTSILKSFTADLCAQVIGTRLITQAGAVVQRSAVQRSDAQRSDAQRSAISPVQCQSILEQIEQANLFIIPLDPDRRWYRYHQLFSDLLQKRLEELAPESIPDLALRASQWFEGQGLMEPAVEYALLSKNYRYSAGLLESNAENLLLRGELMNFSRWTRALPEDELHAHPLLTVYHGFTLMFDGASEETVENHLRQAERHRPDRASMAAIMTLRSLLLVIRGENRAGMELAKQAAIDLPPEFVFLSNYLHTNLSFMNLWSGSSAGAVHFLEEALDAGKKARNLVFTPLVMRRLARLYIALGQLQKGGQYLDQALKIAATPDGELLPHAGMILISRGGLKREWNDLDEAIKDIRKGIDLLGQWGKVRLADGYVVLAETLQARGDWGAAREAMNQAVEKAHQTEEYEIDDVRVAYSQALLAIRQGDLTSAQEWASTTGLDNDPGPSARLSGDQPLPNPLRNYLRRAEYLVLARLRLAQGQPELALQTLEELLKVFEQEGWVGFILEAEILRALAFDARGERTACFRSLRRALELCKKGGYLRMFLDEGDSLRTLLQRFQREAGADQKDLDACIQRLIAGFSAQPFHLQAEPTAKPAQAILAEALSERELEVLRLLATYLTVPEIASRIGVSTSTVRTHIKHIYGKLDVHTRIEAVERARGSDLI